MALILCQKIFQQSSISTSKKNLDAMITNSQTFTQIRNPIVICRTVHIMQRFLIGPMRLQTTHILSAGDSTCQSKGIFITSCWSLIIVSQDKPRDRQELQRDHWSSIDIFSDTIIQTSLDSLLDIFDLSLLVCLLSFWKTWINWVGTMRQWWTAP